MKIVIIGGGFGGIKTALMLAKHREFKVTLISDRDHFTYYPSLYAVATGGSQRQSFVPLEDIFHGTPVTLIHDSIEGYDPVRKLLRGKGGIYQFDKAVFALGVVTSYFGIKGLEEHCFGIKTSAEIATFRRHIHDEMVKDRKIDKQYIVAGAGPTGVELSASLVSYIDHIARAHDIRHTKIRVKLVEAGNRVLPRMNERTSRLVKARLKKLGVDLLLNKKVEWQDDNEVQINGRAYPTHTVVWTSGVSNNPFFGRNDHHFMLSDSKRVLVNEHMMVNDHTYVIGDNAQTPYSGLAQTALHDALYVAKDIVQSKMKRPRPVYSLKKPPVVIPVGKRWAVFEWHWFTMHGYISHLIRRAADFIGYHDVLPLGLAFESWQSEYRNDDPCADCRNIR